MFTPRAWCICGIVGLCRMMISESLTGAWYGTYSSVLALPQGTAFETVAPKVIRLGGYHGGWYGFWYHDDQEYTGYEPGIWSRIGRAGIRRMIYLDGGGVGDYVGFFDANGEMVRKNWSLPFWTGSPPIKTARWFGSEGSMEDLDWAPNPTVQDYALPAFAYPDGSSIEPGGFNNSIGKRSNDSAISTLLDTAANIECARLSNRNSTRSVSV